MLLTISVLVALLRCSSSVVYNDTLARQVYPLAAAAYDESPEKCLKNRFKNSEVLFNRSIKKKIF